MRFGVKIGPFYASTSTRRSSNEPGCLSSYLKIMLFAFPPVLLYEGIDHGSWGEGIGGTVLLLIEALFVWLWLKEQ